MDQQEPRLFIATRYSVAIQMSKNQQKHGHKTTPVKKPRRCKQEVGKDFATIDDYASLLPGIEIGKRKRCAS
jgi:hypothetical protein